MPFNIAVVFFIVKLYALFYLYFNSTHSPRHYKETRLCCHQAIGY